MTTKKLEKLDHQILDLSISFQEHQWNVMSARDVKFITDFKKELEQLTDNAHTILLEAAKEKVK